MAKLTQQSGEGAGREFALDGACLIGRDPEAAIALDHPSVSRHHAELRREGEAWVVTDLNSRNGTFLNGRRLEPGESTPLHDGSLLGIAAIEFACRLETPQGKMPVQEERPTHTIPVLASVTVGRDAACDIVLDFPYVSRRHCQIRQTPPGYTLEDLNSSNGTFLNGQRVTGPTLLHEGDEVRIGLSRLVFRNGALDHYEQTGRVRLNAIALGQVVHRGGRALPLLHEVSFVVEPQEFVAIVGASGAGKTTLLNALTGFRPASSGGVLLNGVDYYSHIELFRAAIGYVPQDDIVHRELTVSAVLRYTAQLRLPPDTSPAEIEKLIDNVLRELELSHRKDALVQTLSGGERKRVNVGVELLTRPSLLFLDEPTSGLDPGLERKFIGLVQQLTREGRTILMVTHATSSIAQCDMLLFLARGGRVAFYGPPQEALTFFEVDDYADAYLRVNDPEQEPEYWEQRYRESEYYERYVRARQERAPAQSGQTTFVAAALGASRPKASGTAQFAILCKRYLDTLRGDPRNLAFLLGQAPVIALILALIFKANIFTGETPAAPGLPPKDFPIRNAPTLLFCLVISAILFGVCNAAREITKERPIYRRERLVNLQLAPYLLSKAAVLFGLCFLQSFILLAVVRFKVDFAVGGLSLLGLFFTILLAAVCGMLSGLAVSSIATTNDQAMSLVPIAVLPQIIFSGAISQLRSMGGMTDTISQFMPSHWAFGALCRLTELRERFEASHIGYLANSAFDTHIGAAWAALLGIALGYGLLSGWLLRLKEKQGV